MILELKSGKSRATKDTTKFVMWDNEKHDYNFHGEAENKGVKCISKISGSRHKQNAKNGIKVIPNCYENMSIEFHILKENL